MRLAPCLVCLPIRLLVNRSAWYAKLTASTGGHSTFYYEPEYVYGPFAKVMDSSIARYDSTKAVYICEIEVLYMYIRIIIASGQCCHDSPLNRVKQRLRYSERAHM